GTYTATITNNTVETVRVSAAFDGSDVGNAVDVSFTFTSKTINFKGSIYKTMKSPSTGRIWLDRNLGATQTQEVNSGTNSAAYGDIYQWGRRKDGHESRGSGKISTRLASITATDNRFIVNNETPDDWTTNRAVDDNGEDRMAAWADGGVNDICPAGFSVPTKAELFADTRDFRNTAEALSSFLRIPTAGFRGHIDGALGNVGADANLWTRSVKGSKSYSLNMFKESARFNEAVRTMGFSVRCIRVRVKQ
ncbi:hypothetical protein BSPLISOX_2673, partial [uncultured Gammaproteobacteria bacterium]